MYFVLGTVYRSDQGWTCPCWLRASGSGSDCGSNHSAMYRHVILCDKTVASTGRYSRAQSTRAERPGRSQGIQGLPSICQSSEEMQPLDLRVVKGSLPTCHSPQQTRPRPSASAAERMKAPLLRQVLLYPLHSPSRSAELCEWHMQLDIVGAFVSPCPAHGQLGG